MVTLKEIDMVHQRPDGTARKRFNDNKEHFIEGEDFFKVKCSEVRPFFGQTLPNGYNPNADIILITESGYYMLVKSFTDDLSWTVQRELVNSYFKVKHLPQMSQMEMIAGIANGCVELEQQIEALEDRPVEVAVQANDAEIDKLTAQFQEELAKRDKDTERRLNEQSQRHKEELRKQREQLEKAAEEADVEVEDEIREKAELEMHIKFVTDAMRKLAHWLFVNDPVGENGYRHYAAKKIEEVSKIITKEEE